VIAFYFVVTVCFNLASWLQYTNRLTYLLTYLLLPLHSARIGCRQTADASEQNNTGPLGGPVIMHVVTLFIVPVCDITY